MKKIKMYEFVQNFKELEGLEGFEFVVAVTKNNSAFKNEIEALDKGRSPSEEYKEYADKVSSIIRKYADKTENGDPIITNDEIKGKSVQLSKENKPLLEKESDALSKKYEETIKKHKEKEEKFRKELEKDVTIKFDKIEKDDLPKNINTKQLSLVYDMIKW